MNNEDKSESIFNNVGIFKDSESHFELGLYDYMNNIFQIKKNLGIENESRVN